MKTTKAPKSLGILDPELVGKHAFTAVVEGAGFIIGRADYGIGGFTPTRHAAFKTYEEAMRFADGLNEREGLTKEQAFKIVLNTMR